MEKIKAVTLEWLQPAIIIAVILYVMDIQIDRVNSRIDGVNSRIDGIQKELSLFREDVNRSLFRHDTAIQHTDNKIDGLKNSLLSRQK